MPRKFKVVISPLLTEDLQKIVNYYKEVTKNHKIGRKFLRETKRKILLLETNALQYEVKYHSVRCVKINSFPYRIHFIVDELEKSVYVMGVFGTSELPRNWER